MNIQTDLSGQISGKVLNQVGASLSGLPQQNVNPVPGQMQTPMMRGNNIPNMDPERRYMQQKIFEFLMQRRQHSPEAPPSRIFDLVKRLELGLFKSSQTTEEYMNLDTLGNRLQVLIKRLSSSNHNQQLQQGNPSPPVGTMIPTPGFQQPGNSSLTRSLPSDSSLATNHGSTPSTFNSGSFMSTGNGSSGNMHGALASGYHQSSSFSPNPGGNHLISSMGAQRPTSQMIPTPGFNSASDANNNSNSQSFMNMESSSNDGAFAAAKTTTVSQPMRQMQHGGSQNSRILRNLGGPMGGGIRSTLQQHPGGISNGSLNGGLGMIGNNMPQMNGPGTTEGYLTDTMHRNSPRPLNPRFEHQRPVIHSNGYGTATTSGPGNSYTSMNSVGMMTNSELNAASMQSVTKTNSGVMVSQPNVDAAQQVKNNEPQLNNQLDNMNSQYRFSARENLAQPQNEQLVQNEALQNQQSENQLWLNEDIYSQSQFSASMGSESKSRSGAEYHVEGLQSQVTERGQFSDMPYEQNSREHHSRSTQLLPNVSGPQDFQSSRTLSSDQIHQFNANHQNSHGSHSSGALRVAASHDQWSSKSQDVSHVSGQNPLEQNVKKEFHHRSTGADAAQLNNLSSGESMIFRSDASRPVNTPKMGNPVRGLNINRDVQYKNQQRWLALLMHARRCTDQEKCAEKNCLTVQRLLKHVERCAYPRGEERCSYARCHASKTLIGHYLKCGDAKCPVCVRVREFARSQQRKALSSSDINSGLPGLVNGSCKSYNTYDVAARPIPKTTPVLAQTPEDLQPSIKRIKIEQASQPLVSANEASGAPVSGINEPPPKDAQHADQHHESHSAKISDISEVKMEVSESVGQSSPKIPEKKKDSLDNAYVKKLEGESIASQNPSSFGVQEVIVKNENEVGKNNIETLSVPSESTSKSGKPKVKAVSMTELFTPEQVRQHITGLRQWVGQSKAKAERNQAMEHSMSENSCQLCAVERLTFEPPPLYCTTCGARVKRNAMYYTIGAGETRHYFCIPCYNEVRGETMRVDGMAIAKGKMEKKRNDEETEESWVQCDKCEAWQHQICALFNARRNDCGQAEYTCPNCYVEEVERGERVPLPQSAVLGAKDLPRTILSDHLEHRLSAKLRQERLERARSQGKSYDEVPGAESLVVRVVSSVDKKLEVKPRFLEIFREENYPPEFPYKSKVVLLFQKIEGVEVCLFGMYLQEFGSECQQPNHRRVYLSYLDSVKYFRPDVKTVTGEALRTYVYHEILIGYLEYCKQRGFASCYIWACPPLKGEDYILYCHPEIQKTPRSDKLREWYLSMLRKAKSENIVVELTNLHEHFFVANGECRAKITAARLPYFDGDYWPGAAEDMIFQLQEEEDGRKQPKKGAMKKTISKRALKASGQLDLSGKASKDLMLMHKLGETISPMKEDFIMVNLQSTCTHCRILMVSGRTWLCRQCPRNFQLCERCYEAERRREDRERHPINHKDKHALYPVEIQGIPDNTKDKDDVVESEFFDTRQAFLSLCQGNHYQYDTLRRAKHSSMMVLYHLHNPTAPAFVATCNICHTDIETGQGWRCETCPEYDVCNNCHLKDRGMSHPHKLISYSSSAQNTEARALRVMQLKKMLELLVHASRCRSPQCQYPNCRKVKGLFRHGMACKIRAGGGCILCKKMWNLLQLHARTCKESQCTVPRCRDLKEHSLRQQHQSENRRRAAFNEMIVRQRAADSTDDS